MAGPGLTIHEFVSRVFELAAADSAQGWLTAASDTADMAVGPMCRGFADEPAAGTALIVTCHLGHGELRDGRLSGRWPSVIGARYAEWLLLPVHVGSAGHLLVSRDAADIDTAGDQVALAAAGVSDVTVSDVAVGEARVLDGGDHTGALFTGAGAAAAVVGSAAGLWRTNVERLRAQLAASHGGDEITDALAAEVARAASDIDAARLQITESLTAHSDLDEAVRICRQAVARARSAADRLLGRGKQALDASNPVTRRWREVDAGSRLAVRLLDGIAAPLG